MIKYMAAAVASVAAWKSDIDLIKQGEGRRKCTYLDTMGLKTVCYGFNIDRGNTRSTVQAAGGNFDAINKVGGCTTQQVCNNLLDKEIASARSIGRNFATVSCPAAQAVVTDMAYNLGAGGLGAFQKFKAALNRKDWNGAAYEIGNSAYCRQVGYRCSRNQAQIKEC